MLQRSLHTIIISCHSLIFGILSTLSQLHESKSRRLFGKLDKYFCSDYRNYTLLIGAMNVASPFRISEEDLKIVKSGGNIKAVGALLEKQGHQYVTISYRRGSKLPSSKFPPTPIDDLTLCRYCRTHTGLPLEVQSTFTLHRDILHTVLLPVRLICAKAAHYARSILSFHQPSCPRRLAADLEVAFRGQARSAFYWIQCFTYQEQDWVLTKG